MGTHARKSSWPLRSRQGHSAAVAAAVKDFRFDRRLESDVDTYRLLIEEGLKAMAGQAERICQRTDEWLI